jgi:hypothetical protein
MLMLMLSGCASPIPPTPAVPPSPSPVESPLPNGMTRVTAKSAMALPGVSQPFTLYTHCGLEHVVIDFAGSLWDPVSVPAPPRGVGDPNAGIAARTGVADPFDEGAITLTGIGSAVFVAASGVRIDLVPHPGPKDVMVCY